MFPDSNWLNALKLPTQVVIGVFIACVLILILDWKGVIVLNQFGVITKTIVIIIAVLTGSLSLTGIIDFFKNQFLNKQKRRALVERRRVREEEDKKKREESRNNAIQRLEHLSCKEIWYLADCLKEGSQSFYTYVHSPPVTTLMGKGLVYTPGGTHHQDHYPFTIYDYVWDELLARKEEFLEKQANCEREEEERKRKQRMRR